MNQFYVLDVGNSCIKVGLCNSNNVVGVRVLAHGIENWGLLIENAPTKWIISGVVPALVQEIRTALLKRGHDVRVIDRQELIPVKTAVDSPTTIGLDRLFDALAAIKLFPEKKLLVIDAGTAITINSISADAVFQGGAILPGSFLMARSLNAHTAQLPLVDLSQRLPQQEVIECIRFPGKSTTAAIESGILYAAAGAIERCASEDDSEIVLFTGGFGAFLYFATRVPQTKVFESYLTLEGIRIVAEALP